MAIIFVLKKNYFLERIQKIDPEITWFIIDRFKEQWLKIEELLAPHISLFDEHLKSQWDNRTKLIST